MKLGLTFQINCLLRLKERKKDQRFIGLFMQTSKESKELFDNAVSFLACSELYFSEAFSFEVGLPCPKGGRSSIIYCNILTLVF